MSDTDTQELLAPEPLFTTSPFKWVAYMGPSGSPSQTQVVVGTDGVASGGAAPGAFVAGDLYIVAVTFGGSQSNVQISGTGWTQLIQTTSGGYQLFVWAKNVQAGETGIYTVSWSGSSTSTWMSWNYGAAKPDSWNAQIANSGASTNAIAPACAPSNAADVLLAYWLTVGGTAPSSLGLPGSLTSRSNVQQTGVPCRGASGDMILGAAGATSQLVATTDAQNRDYIGFQLALGPSTITPGAFKWISYQSAATLAPATSVTIGTTNVAQALGAFAPGDLYIVALFYWGQSGVDPGAVTMPGSGWTRIVNAGPDSALARFAVWTKTVAAGETGIYTINFPTTTTFAWTSWNYGQVTPDAWNGQLVMNPPGTNTAVAPSCSPMRPPSILLAAWVGDAQSALTLPALTVRANVQQNHVWFMGSGDTPLSATGPTANLTATTNTAGGQGDYGAFQLAMSAATTPPPSGGGGTGGVFPQFTPLIPPPLIGGTAPAFPPPATPAQMQGPLIGPAIGAAGVPPSTAGITQPQFGSGSATSPAANGYFTQFTTTFPVPTIVFSNVITIPTGNFNTGWTSTLPPQTPSTICVHASGIALAAEAETEDAEPEIPPPEQLPPRNGPRPRGRPRRDA